MIEIQTKQKKKEEEDESKQADVKKVSFWGTNSCSIFKINRHITQYEKKRKRKRKRERKEY